MVFEGDEVGQAFLQLDGRPPAGDVLAPHTGDRGLLVEQGDGGEHAKDDQAETEGRRRPEVPPLQPAHRRPLGPTLRRVTAASRVDTTTYGSGSGSVRSRN